VHVARSTHRTTLVVRIVRRSPYTHFYFEKALDFRNNGFSDKG